MERNTKLSEDYEVIEVWDKRKIIGFAIVALIVAGVIGYVFLAGFTIELPDLPAMELPDMVPTENLQLDQVQPTNQLKPDYRQFLEFGLSEDDLLDIQNLPCSIALQNETISNTDPKFLNVMDVRISECL